MRILVLSGGEAKGDGQAGAAYELRNHGWEWDYVIGTSVGALNGAMIAQNKWSQLRDIWHTITRKQVFTPRLTTFNAVWRLLRGKSSLVDTKPLAKLIDKYVNEDDFKIPYECCVTLLDDGSLTYARADRDMILASATMPVIFPAVMDMGYGLVDGGIRENIPLSRAFDLGATHITVITTHRPLSSFSNPKNMIQTGARALSIMLDEIADNDIKETLRINSLVLQAKEMNVTLYKDNGQPYRYVPIDIIHPRSSYGDRLLDFSDRSWERGRDTVKKYLADRGTDKQIS